MRLLRRRTPVEAKRSGPVDRLLTLPDVELDAVRLVEGCAAHFCGVPLDANPWPRNYPDLWEAWRCGWLSGSFYRDYCGADDAQRWLCETTNNN